MIKVKVKITSSFEINLPINSFEEITDENMKIEDSDALIKDIICEQYNFIPDKIVGVSKL